MSRETEAEVDEIVRALDSVGFHAKQFTEWLAAKRFEMLDPYRGFWFYKCRYGVVCFRMRSLGGPTRVDLCSYNPTGGEAVVDLVSNGRSRSGMTFSPAELEFLTREANAEAAKPLEQKVRETIADYLQVSRDELTNDMSFEDELLGVVVEDLALELEDEFGVEIPIEDVEQFETVGDVVSYMKRRLKT